MLSVICGVSLMLSVTYKPFMLSVIMLSVVVANESYSQDKAENEESMLFGFIPLIVT